MAAGRVNDVASLELVITLITVHLKFYGRGYIGGNPHSEEVR